MDWEHKRDHMSDLIGVAQDILEKLEELREERNSEKRCEIMDQLVQILIQVGFSLCLEIFLAPVKFCC